MKITYRNISELEEVAKKIIIFAKDLKIWTFEGQMGVGKTTLIQSICKVLEVEDTVQSPTYALVNEYQTINKNIIYHFDFYRIKDEEEALDMGYEDYFYDDKYCFIEWPSKIVSLIPDKHLSIKIEVENNSRVIQLEEYE